MMEVFGAALRDFGKVQRAVDQRLWLLGIARRQVASAIRSKYRRSETPLAEAEALTGRGIRSSDDAREAARRILGMGPSAVVVNGGHAAGDEIVDLLFDGERFVEFRVARVHTRNTHGTGCTFASAIAAYLARGHSLADATERAQAYVAGAVRHGLAIGKGHGPLEHFWQTRLS